MNKAIVGKKIGMSQVFDVDGKVIPVTVVEAGPCPIVQVKTKEKDGYAAIQVGFGSIKASNVIKPQMARFKKANVAPTRILRELRLDNSADYKVGEYVKCTIFAVGDKVDVSGTSKGKGFTGPIKRWNFHIGPMAHGSGYHRGVGSMGANSTPGRVFKNKKMAGQWGHEASTVQNLTVVRINEEHNLLLIKGAIPGPAGSYVTVKQTCKRRK